MADTGKGASMSISREDYLADIYRIQAIGLSVNTGDVAQRLGVSPASTSTMFKRLAEEGLVHYESYNGVWLTEVGERAASRIVRRHRIIERFLVDVLGFAWERVDELADRMEHAMPDEVLGAIEGLLGGPETCPHGFPIPSSDGGLAMATGQPLEALAAGERAVVRRVDESDKELLRYLRERRLTPGAVVEVLEVNPIDGTRLLRIQGDTLVIGQRIAGALAIEKVSADAG